ncbi:MAG: RAD52 family DNA repair protein [Chloroflexi bacterium]|nr:RAD52 family DNA repair protein [Chloroflexota bacterium]
MFDKYERLAAPFDVTFTDTRGGVELRYVTGEQVARRLNEVLGVNGWSFRILRHDINPEADEAWALGELVAEIGERTVVRQQFGSQKIRRSRTTGTPLDLGFDLKGASTDALKKCASLLGVGLYLSRREASGPVGTRF